MSSSTAIKISHPKSKPWSRVDIACAYLSGLLIYALSPPWMIALFRVCSAPVWLLNALAFLYSPLTALRQSVDAIDAFYNAYRILLNPWLSGI